MQESEHKLINEKKWNKRSETFDKKRFIYFRIFQKHIISLLNLKGNDYLLDVGCGTGWAVRYAANILKEGGEAYGIDLSPKMIERAKINSEAYTNAFFQVGNSEELRFGDNFFNYIICTNSFHHYYDPVKVLNEMRRVLKPQGRIYILDPTGDGFLMKWINQLTLKKEPEHIGFYTNKKFRNFMTQANLKHISSKIYLYPLKIHVAEK